MREGTNPHRNLWFLSNQLLQNLWSLRDQLFDSLSIIHSFGEVLDRLLRLSLHPSHCTLVGAAAGKIIRVKLVGQKNDHHKAADHVRHMARLIHGERPAQKIILPVR